MTFNPRYSALAALAVWGVATSAFALTQEQKTACFAAKGSQQDQLDSCSAVIASGLESGRRLVIAYNNRGFILSQTGHEDAAIADYDRALALDASYVRARNNRAISLYKQGRYADARANFDQVLRVSPKLAPAVFGRGMAATKLGDTGSGKTDVSLALALAPGVAGAMGKLGVR